MDEQRPTRKENPLALAALGRAIERAGLKHADLTMVRQGRQAQAKARAATEPESSPRKS